MNAVTCGPEYQKNVNVTANWGLAAWPFCPGTQAL